jgi:hypothetical protein
VEPVRPIRVKPTPSSSFTRPGTQPGPIQPILIHTHPSCLLS